MATTGPGSSNIAQSRSNVSVTSINCETSQCQSDLIAVTAAANMSNISANSSTTMVMGHSGAIPSPSSHLPSISGNNSENNHFFGNVGIRISVPKMEESDESETELSNIENTAIVNMRSTNRNPNVPRPMSWEGELSETEDGMEAENLINCEEPPKIVPFTSSSSTMHANDFELMNHQTTAMPLLTKDSIKPEYSDIQIDPVFGSKSNINNSFLVDFKKDSNKKYANELPTLKYEPGTLESNSLNSPHLARSKTTLLPANPSPDSAIHSVYTHSSPSQSPLTSRHTPYTSSLSRNNSDASHSSCYSYSSEFSPTHSPIQGRHNMYNNFNGSPLHHSILYRPLLEGTNSGNSGSSTSIDGQRSNTSQMEDIPYEGETIPSAGISRQQLINSPCPICGDKISGFHYGIFSCESCKGFFKRTVQNRKNYVCLRGAACPVTIATRKKCPACRFEKCLQRGMKLEAIREDRTRGGRSTYQCSYTLPNSMLSPPLNADGAQMTSNYRNLNGSMFKAGTLEGCSNSARNKQTIPTLLQEIMDVEHLWQYNESELNRLNQTHPRPSDSPATNPLLVSAGLTNGDNSNPDLIANLCNIADHRLYKIVKWCKSLPLFKNISIDDQICLLINAWCELLLFSCCFRSMTTPGEVRIGVGKSINLAQAKSNGLHACIERMLNLTDHLRRLRVDKYEYVAMKVIVLLQSDTSELIEPEKVRASQEKALQALQAYTLGHYPDTPAKFGELLLRIPELQRTSQVGKEMLTVKSKDGEDFNILMELLRGEH